MGKARRQFAAPHFEQVPLEVVKRIVEVIPQEDLASCFLCGDPLDLEHCKINELGKAVHEECYLEQVGLSPRNARGTIQELCEKISVETDPTRFQLLIRELNRLLDNNEERLDERKLIHLPRHKPPA